MSRAEASLFLPPCGCVRAGALGSYGNEFCFQGTRPPSPWPPPRQGCSLAAARAHGGSVLVHCCSGRKVHPKPPDLTEAALLVSFAPWGVQSTCRNPETEAQRGEVIFPGFHSWSPGGGI